MTAIRLGVIGAGIMGERMLRAALDHAADTVQIVGVWDPSAAARARIAAGLPGVSLAASAEALIAAADCVYIASPPASHLPLSAAVLAAGKAVFCEKPLASDVAAAAAFVESARGKRAAVNFPMAAGSPRGPLARRSGWRSRSRSPTGRAAGSRMRQAGSTARPKVALPGRWCRISCSSPGGWSGR